jgi:ATP-dependent Lon protease
VPKGNEADLDDIPEDVRQALTFHCVSTLDEALEITLASSSGDSYEGRAGFEDPAFTDKRVALHA